MNEPRKHGRGFFSGATSPCTGLRKAAGGLHALPSAGPREARRAQTTAKTGGELKEGESKGAASASTSNWCRAFLSRLNRY